MESEDNEEKIDVYFINSSLTMLIKILKFYVKLKLTARTCLKNVWKAQPRKLRSAAAVKNEDNEGKRIRENIFVCSKFNCEISHFKYCELIKSKADFTCKRAYNSNFMKKL